jgi:hypothetical protein
MIILLASLSGIYIVKILTDKYLTIEKLFLGYAVGVGIINLFITIILVFSDVNRDLLLMLLTVLFAIVFLINLIKEKKIIIIGPFQKFNIVSNKLFLLLLGYLLIITCLLIIWPVHAWDALTLYDFRAKYFLSGGNIFDLSQINIYDKGRESYYFSYPLLTTSLHLASYFDGFSNPKIFYLPFVIGTSLVIYKFLKSVGVGKNISIFILLLFNTFPLYFSISRIAYTNSVYIFYLLVGIIYLIKYIKIKKLGLIVLSLLFVYFSTQTRSTEPLILIPVLIMTIYLFKKLVGLIHWIIYSLFTLFSYFSWQILMKYLNISFPNKQLSFGEIIVLGIKNFDFHLLYNVIIYFTESLLSTYSIIIAIFLISSAIVYGSKKRLVNFQIKALLLSALFLLILLFIGTYFLSFSFERWNKISDSLQRTALPLVPIVLTSSAALLNVKKTKR